VPIPAPAEDVLQEEQEEEAGPTSEYEQHYHEYKTGQATKVKGGGFNSQRPMSPRRSARSRSPVSPARPEVPAVPIPAPAEDVRQEEQEEAEYPMSEYEQHYQAHKESKAASAVKVRGGGFNSQRPMSPRSRRPREASQPLPEAEDPEADYLKQIPDAQAEYKEEYRRAKHLAALKEVERMELRNAQAEEVQAREAYYQEQERAAAQAAAARDAEQRAAQKHREQEDAQRALEAKRRMDHEASRSAQPVVVRRTVDGGYQGYRHESGRHAAPGEAPARTPVMPMITSQQRIDQSGCLAVKTRTFTF